jgi:hypothetical protein
MTILTDSVVPFDACKPVTKVYAKIRLVTPVCASRTGGDLITTGVSVTLSAANTWASCELVCNQNIAPPNSYYEVETYSGGSIGASNQATGGTLVAKYSVIVPCDTTGVPIEVNTLTPTPIC